MKPRFSSLVLGLSAALLGCSSATSNYVPSVIARGELVMNYDRGFELWSGGQLVADAHGYRGLSSFVGCVPDAHRHAVEAESSGAQARGFAVTAGGLALLGLGGLSGLAFLDKN